MAAYPEDGDGGVSANGVGGITFVFTRVFCDLEVHDAQLGVVLFADDEEAARGVDDILLGARKGENTQESEGGRARAEGRSAFSAGHWLGQGSSV